MPAEALSDESRGESPGRGRLLGRRILVVGAGQGEHGVEDPPIGNGRATALLCARGRPRRRGRPRPRQRRRDRRSITDRAGEATALYADVADPTLIDVMVADAASSLDGLDGVVYNVGIGAGLGLAASTPEIWDFVLAINLRGAMLTARAALPLLDAGASIVFISSIAGLKPGSRIPAYDASKAALGGLMRHVALRARVRVSAPTSSPPA